MKNKKIIFATATILLLGAFWLGKNFYKSYESKRLSFLGQENSALFVRDYSPQYGHAQARVYLTEFLDPECESCRAFYPQLKRLLNENEFKDKVKLVVRYAPFHRNSEIAIRVLEASREQKKYWEALELLFKYQPYWGNHHNPQPNLIFDYLPEIGIDVAKLKSDMQSSKIESIIKQDLEDLRQLKVRGTPTFFVNGKPLEQFGISYLRDALQREVEFVYE